MTVLLFTYKLEHCFCVRGLPPIHYICAKLYKVPTRLVKASDAPAYFPVAKKATALYIIIHEAESRNKNCFSATSKYRNLGKK